MTGEKDRFTTTEKLWKLEDGDLSTPQHDELVFQLMSVKNAKKLLEFIGLCDEHWKIGGDNYKYVEFVRAEHAWERSTSECFPYDYENNTEIQSAFDIFIASVYSPLKQCIKDKLAEFFSQKIDKTSQVIKCEVPIQTGNNSFIAGYIDVQYTTSPMSYVHDIQLAPTEYKYKDRHGFSCILKVRPPTCHVNMLNNSLDSIKSLDSSDRKVINIEVKPRIKSFGETLRQVNTYRKLLGDKAEYVIYSPDKRFKEAFESQGIIFVSPADLGL